MTNNHQLPFHAYEIRIYRYGEIVKRFYPTCWAEARGIYAVNARAWEQYTQLVVDGRELTTAQAERFLDVDDRASLY